MFSIFKKKEIEQPKELKAILSGQVIPLNQVPDQVFSARIMGDGVAVEPENCTVYAPADSEVIAVMEDSRHACGLKLENGMEILIHVGLDTVEMKGDGFELFVKMGDQVAAGDPLISFDPEKIQKAGHPTITVMTVTDEGKAKNITFHTGFHATAKESVLAEFQ